MGQSVMQTFYEVKGAPLKEEFVINSKNQLDGEYTSYFEDGTIKSKGFFIENTSSGEWSYYFESGELRMIGTVVDGKNHGVWQYYYESGGKKMEGLLTDGKRTGIWIIYARNGAKQTEGTYENNARVGTWKYYASSGGLKATEEISVDFSLYSEYHISGEIKSKGKKFDGKKEGSWLFYYEDGSKQAKGTYKEGKKFGPWIYYNESGSVKAEGNYINDLSDGIWVHYFESGITRTKGKLYKGRKDGEWRLYYADGKLKGEANYELGNGIYKEYYKTGALKVKGKVVNGKNQGAWQYYYESGYLEGECHFRNGEGEFIGYYPPKTHKEIREGLLGKQKMKGLIRDEKKVGIWELFERNGDLAGYYKPYYEGENEGFLLANEEEEQKVLSAEKRKVSIGSYSYSSSGSRYFKSKLNEHRAYIINYNPIAIFYNTLPLSLEYYMNERLGYELLLQYIRDPFLKDFSGIENGKAYMQGFSASFRQKFYQKGTDFGVPYFAHELRYTYLQHYANIIDNPIQGAFESKYEYAVLIGFRYFKNKQDNGFTIDVFLGTSIGYRDFVKTYESNRISDPFSNLNSNDLSLSLRGGFHLGYTFKTRKF
ncbi:MAG: toxin-antitoxin system YwqK family antitoxin [Cyclobacteriaceae bacterium]|nr:toxin-antitoxin system YwqK family antitoxin [Cyclobacteriaceae bacterium]